jgi:hypothetical protein
MTKTEMESVNVPAPAAISVDCCDSALERAANSWN